MTEMIATIVLTQKEAQERVVCELEAALKELSVSGKSATYEEFAERVDMGSDMNKLKTLLKRARDRVHLLGYDFQVIRGSGLKPISTVESIKQVGQTSRRGIRGHVDRWGNHLNVVDYSRLGQEDLNVYIRESLAQHKYDEMNKEPVIKEHVDVALESLDDPLSPDNFKKMLLAAKTTLRHIG